MNPVFNVLASTNAAGEKTLDVLVYGVIAQGFADTVDARAIAAALFEHRDAVAITTHINSIGGDLYDGIAIFNMIQNHGAAVTSIIEGAAMSAASVIALAGRTVMMPGSVMLVHSPWTVVQGNAKELRRVAADLDKGNEALVAIYRKKTGKSAADLRALLDAETLMTADQALRNHFIDEIAADAPATIEAIGDQMLFNRVAFPMDRLPQGVLAMAKNAQAGAKAAPPAPPKAAEIDPPGPPAEPDLQLEEEAPEAEQPEAEPALAVAEPAPPAAKGRAPVTRAELFALAPETMAAAIADARAEGVKEERARVVAIEELGLKGHDDLVRAALRDGTDARDLAVAVVKARTDANSALIESRRTESKEAAGIRPSAPEKTTEASEREVAKNIARIANDRRGGVR